MDYSIYSTYSVRSTYILRTYPSPNHGGLISLTFPSTPASPECTLNKSRSDRTPNRAGSEWTTIHHCQGPHSVPTVYSYIHMYCSYRGLLVKWKAPCIPLAARMRVHSCVVGRYSILHAQTNPKHSYPLRSTTRSMYSMLAIVLLCPEDSHGIKNYDVSTNLPIM